MMFLFHNFPVVVVLYCHPCLISELFTGPSLCLYLILTERFLPWYVFWAALGLDLCISKEKRKEEQEEQNQNFLILFSRLLGLMNL